MEGGHDAGGAVEGDKRLRAYRDPTADMAIGNVMRKWKKQGRTRRFSLNRCKEKERGMKGSNQSNQ